MAINYIEAPSEINLSNQSKGWDTSRGIYLPNRLFMAGGISGCSDWQHELHENIKKLFNSQKNRQITLINPRRSNFLNTTEESTKQIQWEYKHIKLSHCVSFWFAKETLCPITLFELGKCLGRYKEVFIGIDPAYGRKLDVEVQSKLEKSDISITYSLFDLAVNIFEWSREYRT